MLRQIDTTWTETTFTIVTVYGDTTLLTTTLARHSYC